MKDLFRAEAIINKENQIDGDVHLYQGNILSLYAIIIVFFITILLVFIIKFEFSKNINVSGVITLKSSLIQITADSKGYIDKIFVKEGDFINKGDSLIQISNKKYGVNDFEYFEGSISKKIESKLSLIEKKEDDFQLWEIKNKNINKIKLKLNEDLQSLYEQKSIIGERIDLKQVSLDKMDKLSESSYISSIEIINRKDSILALKQIKNDILTKIRHINFEQEELKTKISQNNYTYEASIREIEEKISTIEYEVNQLRQSSLMIIRSPVDGLVAQIYAIQDHEVEKNKTLFKLIPNYESYKIATIFIPNKFIGLIQLDQNVTIKLHTYPYEHYGVLNGVISEIESMPLNSFDEINLENNKNMHFRARVLIKSGNGVLDNYEDKLNSGLELTAEILTESRTIYEWIFNPIFTLKK